MISNDFIAKKLDEYALLLELKGEDIFKIRAYKRAAENIRKYNESIALLLKDGRTFHIDGIGNHILKKIDNIITTGSFEELDKLKSELPETLFELFKLPSLGPKKIYKLYKDFGIKNLRELEQACQENKLKEIKGFSDKIQQQIIQGIAFLKNTEGNKLYVDVEPIVKSLEETLKSTKSVINIATAGDYRRKLEVIKDIDVVISSDNNNFINDIQPFSYFKHIKTTSNNDISFLIDNFPINIHIVNERCFCLALHHYTGNKSHIEKLKAFAKSKGYTFNNFNFYKNKEKIEISDERNIYKMIGLKYIIPEMREGLFEFNLDVNENELIREDDIKGIIHIHTNYSDGMDSCEDIVKESIKKGFKYIGISDHSKSAYYAGGLSVDDLKRQSDELKELQEKFPDIMILHGIESDILPDGSLDYEDNILESLDFVIASIHSHFNMSKEDMTNRISHAIDNPFSTILGHMTGRLLLARRPYDLDIEKIIEKSVKTKTIIELNANPQRLDIDWRYLPEAIKKGALISINPDAHNIRGLFDYIYGVNIARKGGVTKNFILNSFDKEYFLKTIEIKRNKSFKRS